MSSFARLGILSSRVLKPKSIHANQVRHGGGISFYRRSPWAHVQGSISYRLGQGLIFFACMWMFSGLYTEEGRTELFVGHVGYIDASKWTDEELGIPPDEEAV